MLDFPWILILVPNIDKSVKKKSELNFTGLEALLYPDTRVLH